MEVGALDQDKLFISDALDQVINAQAWIPQQISLEILGAPCYASGAAIDCCR